MKVLEVDVNVIVNCIVAFLLIKSRLNWLELVLSVKKVNRADPC
jgi:hypothetical protein